MTPDTLTRIIDRDPARHRISHLIIWRDAAAGHWALTISYAGMSRVHPGDLPGPGNAPHHKVSIDVDAIPDGVRLRAWERDPDTVHALPEPEGDVKAAIHAAIGRLAESRVLGSPEPLEVERHEPASPEALAHDPWPRWHIRVYRETPKERAL